MTQIKDRLMNWFSTHAQINQVTGLADNLFGVASAVDGTSGIVILEDNQAKLMVLAPDTAIRYMY